MPGIHCPTNSVLFVVAKLRRFLLSHGKSLALSIQIVVGFSLGPLHCSSDSLTCNRRLCHNYYGNVLL